MPGVRGSGNCTRWRLRAHLAPGRLRRHFQGAPLVPPRRPPPLATRVSFRTGSGPAPLGSGQPSSDAVAHCRLRSLPVAHSTPPSASPSPEPTPRRRTTPGALTSRFRTGSGPAPLGSGQPSSDSVAHCRIRAALVRFRSALPVPQPSPGSTGPELLPGVPGDAKDPRPVKDGGLRFVEGKRLTACRILP
jgi:hypothetical protein